MIILGISAFYHDAAVALYIDGEIVAAAQEERFSRIKHDADFPVHSIQYCLKEANISAAQIDAIAFYDKPFLKFERILESYYQSAPKGFLSFLRAIPVWLKNKLFIKQTIKKHFKRIGADVKRLEILFPEHHLSHLASSYFPSDFDEAALLSIDGVGEWATTTIASGKDKDITIHKEIHYPDSLGLLYSACTYFLGFKVNSGEYKVMGLAPYGDEYSEQCKQFIDIIRTELISIMKDGSFQLNQKLFTYNSSLRMVKDKQWEQLFGFPKRQEEAELNSNHFNLALAFQKVTEEVVIKLAKTAKEITGKNKLCLSGGVALNCVANGSLRQEGIFEDIFIQPAAGDAGGALGAALASAYIYYDEERLKKVVPFYDLGPSYTNDSIKTALEDSELKYHQLSKEELLQRTVDLIAQEKVIAWFQGRMEFGPRALGFRSILGDARSKNLQEAMNLKVKQRESFRPFAPAVLEEDLSQCFETNHANPYMLEVHAVKGFEKRSKLDKSIKDQLNGINSPLPAITHVDGSARIQSVNKETNSLFWELIDKFKEKTGSSVLINTSFNVRGEPIIESPEQAINAFLNTDIDTLVIGDFIVLRDENKERKPQRERKFQLD